MAISVMKLSCTIIDHRHTVSFYTIYEELLVSQTFSNNAVGGILIGKFKYCMKRNPCLQYKWLDNGVQLI